MVDANSEDFFERIGFWSLNSIFSLNIGTNASCIAPSANIFLRKKGIKIAMRYASYWLEIPNIYVKDISLNKPVILDKKVAAANIIVPVPKLNKSFPLDIQFIIA